MSGKRRDGVGVKRGATTALADDDGCKVKNYYIYFARDAATGCLSDMPHE